jgi:hypothetical protein
MTGIGNDRALRIWYKAVTERLVGGAGTLTFDDARAESVAAAGDLYGAGAPEVAAVEDAWAAVNVGSAHGAPPRTRVRFTRAGNPYLESQWPAFFTGLQILAVGEPTYPRATVENSADTRVIWSVGGPALFAGDYVDTAGGRIGPDGRLTLPVGQEIDPWLLHYICYRLTARSAADPLQFADGRAFGVFIDTDSDGERDAIDLGGVALSWGLAYAITPAHSVLPYHPWTNVYGATVDDWDVAAIVEATRNAWPAP